jgi:hypothetical protein
MTQYGYIQQCVNGSAATPNHSYIHYIAHIGSLMTYKHVQCTKNSKWGIQGQNITHKIAYN